MALGSLTSVAFNNTNWKKGDPFEFYFIFMGSPVASH